MYQQEERKHIKIQELTEPDILCVAQLHRECFSTDGITSQDSIHWVRCNFKAYPRFVYYIAKKDRNIIGYILWMEKGGFRQQAVLELEQIGVTESWRGKGVAKKLIKKSLSDFINTHILPENRILNLIKLTTGTDNQAQQLYRKALKAEPECVIKDLFEGDELVMLARDIDNILTQED